MGRGNAKYHKDLHQLAYEKLTGMQAFGESKKDAIRDGTAKDKIFSYSTYETYKKHVNYYLHWLKENYPDVTTLKAARRHTGEWLQTRVDQGLSSWTVHTEAKALGKLFGIGPDDLDYFQTPTRHREDIKRSRVETQSDKHFSLTNNDELIKFCRGTGVRRNVAEKLEGRDLWSRERMIAEVQSLERKDVRTNKEEKHLACLKEALKYFPTEDFFLHHRKDKGGRYRFAPVIGPNKSQIVERFLNTGWNEKVWKHVPKAADVHGYRSDYCCTLYRAYARDIADIPFDRINKGTGHAYQSQVYVCRGDSAGIKLDRRAMEICSKALSHNRVSVVINYLHAL